MATVKGSVLPTHYRAINVQKSGLRVREKYILFIICGIFCFLMFGAFFFIPDYGPSDYLNAGKKALSNLVIKNQRRIIDPIMPPIKNVVKVFRGII